MNGSLSPVPAVDTHAHVFHAGMRLAADAWHRPDHEAPLEDYLACLDQAGVDRAVLAAISLFEDADDYALAATAAHPRLRTTVIADPSIPFSRLREMNRLGAVGIRLQWRSTPVIPDLDAPEWRRLLRTIADLGWHVELHDNGARLPASIARIERSGAPLVVDHFGRPDRALGARCAGFQAVLRAVERGHCWVKMSADFRVGSDAMVRELVADLLAHAGADRLFWGSDWPFAGAEQEISYAQTIARFESLVPDPSCRDAIHRTAADFYFGSR
ncbi:amidohydrolase family protein [Sphingosinicella terrae]|uniref:amidohydrolase family protein n=1 Tax=Sphingosinicella terrae TaxID=2172047 RepID=UPI000E0DA915|nr:amidohydrolase family protein [Sphingosinicella terrae]